MDCKACREEFDPPANYFWDLVGDPVQCPHCGAWNNTDWDEDDDGYYGPWTTGVTQS